MSETITASLTVAGGDVITAEINTLARGPAGPTGESGASTWDEITGTASDIPFLPVTAPAHSEGLVFYDSTDKSLVYYNDEADVAMNIGREMWVRVRNDSGSTISNGKVVYINGAQGQLPTIRLARADSATTSRVIGIATHDIGNNEFGYVTSTGEIKGLATNAYNDGDLLFLSAVTAGEMTTTAPLAPNRVIQVATVLHAHPTQGKLYCHPETDSIPSTGIVDSTATGRSLITAATQSDARTTGLGSGATGDELFTAASASAARTTLGQITATSTAQIDSVAYTVGGTPVTGIQSIQLEADTLYELSWYGKFTSNGGSGYLWLNFSSAYDDLGNNGFQQFARFHNTVGSTFLVSTTAIAAAFANLGTLTTRTAHGSIRFKTVLATQVSLGWSQWNGGTVTGTSSLLTAFRVGIRPV